MKHKKTGNRLGTNKVFERLCAHNEFPCDLCESRDSIEVPHARHYTNNQQVHICKKCGFVYVKSRRSSHEIANSWSDEIFGNKNADDKYSARIPAIKARQLYVAEFIDTNIGLKNKDVCDIGSGEGQFLDMIRQKEYGARVFGTEASKKNCSLMSKMGIKHFNGAIEDYCGEQASKNYKADIVTIMWTLENCCSCRDMLSEAHKILKDGGYLVVATGSRILVPFKKPLYLYLSKNPADTHCFRFSANTLRGLLAVSGFEVTHINRYIDSDILCVIAKKVNRGKKIKWQGDDFKKVRDFFKRWHKETLFYRE